MRAPVLPRRSQMVCERTSPAARAGRRSELLSQVRTSALTEAVVPRSVDMIARKGVDRNERFTCRNSRIIGRLAASEAREAHPGPLSLPSGCPRHAALAPTPPH